MNPKGSHQGPGGGRGGSVSRKDLESHWNIPLSQRPQVTLEGLTNLHWILRVFRIYELTI